MIIFASLVRKQDVQALVADIYLLFSYQYDKKIVVSCINLQIYKQFMY